MKKVIKFFPIVLGFVFFLALGFWLGDHSTSIQEEKMETKSTDMPTQAVSEEKTQKDVEELESKLKQKGDQWAQDYPNSLEFRAYDLDTEESYTYTNDEENKKYVTASIAKVAIAMLLLHEKEENQEDLTEEETDLLNRMIVSSDNEAATSLWDSLGGYESLQQLFDNFDMNDTEANEETWGKTTTTTKDQIKLLQEVYTPSEYLNEDSQDYLIDLMNHIDPDQSWGVYAGSSDVSFKNGWLPDDTTGELAVTSIGRVSRGENEYLAVALSDKNSTVEEGSQVIEDLIRISSDYLL